MVFLITWAVIQGVPAAPPVIVAGATPTASNQVLSTPPLGPTLAIPGGESPNTSLPPFCADPFAFCCTYIFSIIFLIIGSIFKAIVGIRP